MNRQPRRWFVGGTGTEVGKTAVICALVRAARTLGVDAGLIKPVSSGIVSTGGVQAAADYAFYAEALDDLDEPDLVTPVVYRDPYAPTVAERVQYGEGNGPDIPAEVDRAWAELCRRHELMFVEGVGGMLVPLPGGLCVADLAVRLETPLLLVADAALGTINHCLLTLEATTRRGIPTTGVVMNRRSAEPSVPESTNPEEVARHGATEVLAVLERRDGLSPRQLVESLARDLEPMLRRLIE